MDLPIYQVDAFASALFRGNPAAIMPLEAWLDDALMQSIAAENNLSETAFFVPEGEAFALRWFTPTAEVDLCGHATLAAAHVLIEHLGYPGSKIRFSTRSGDLTVKRQGDALTLDFPGRELIPESVNLALSESLGAMASETFAPAQGSGPLLLVYEFERDVADLRPDFGALTKATESKVIVTAPGDECDVVSRFFAPQIGIDEDPVTGSAHCSLVPYWAKRLGKTTLQCRQISSRGGELACELVGERVHMTGQAITFLHGTVTL